MNHQEYVAVGKILAYLPEHATLRAEVLARLAKDHCDERRALIFYGDYYFCLLVDKLLEPGYWTNALSTYERLPQTRADKEGVSALPRCYPQMGQRSSSRPRPYQMEKRTRTAVRTPQRIAP